jgi:hypothetical protein
MTRSERDTEVLVKPQAVGALLINISLKKLGIQVTKMFTLKVKSKGELWSSRVGVFLGEELCNGYGL